ncbi:MAG: permease [Melioribacteraceae bacterium]|nr:permease [Melioribacteraceae bacterium]
MSITAIIINGIALILLLIAFLKDRSKSIEALKVAVRSFVKILPSILMIVVLVGIILGVLQPETITQWLGEKSGALGILLTGVLGAVLHIPSLVAFPLAWTLLKSGSSITIIATFIATLTMIGVVTFPLEVKELGKKFAIMRNGLSFLAAILIGWLIGVIL